MIKGNFIDGLSRRRFLTEIMPACSIACLSSGSIWASSLSGKNSFFQEKKHKFEKEYGRKMTYKDFWYQQWNQFVHLTFHYVIP